jgi:hypothetical protein
VCRHSAAPPPPLACTSSSERVAPRHVALHSAVLDSITLHAPCIAASPRRRCQPAWSGEASRPNVSGRRGGAPTCSAMRCCSASRTSRAAAIAPCTRPPTGSDDGGYSNPGFTPGRKLVWAPLLEGRVCGARRMRAGQPRGNTRKQLLVCRTAMKLRIGTLGIAGGRSLTGPLRGARRFPSTRWCPVPRATRATLGFGI